MIEEQYERAFQILKENQDKLTLLANKLLETEVIFKEDLITIFGKRVWDKGETADAPTIKVNATDVIPEVEVPSFKSDDEKTEEKVETDGTNSTPSGEMDSASDEASE